MSRQQRLHETLSTQFSPQHLVVDDESGNHSVPTGSESHFKVLIVSDNFNQLTRITRHRLVNEFVMPEFSNGLHALSLHLYTPEEWERKKETVPASPECKGGSRHP